ncbi:MAG: hypothetical protein M3P30_01840 [Chloroflexota bacterium]|nr:hypothetical protein [Chloroflexota bacterium]
MTTILIIERDDAAMRLLAWGMREEGYTVLTSAGADELVAGERIVPDVIVFNTGMAEDIKRLWGLQPALHRPQHRYHRSLHYERHVYI